MLSDPWKQRSESQGWTCRVDTPQRLPCIEAPLTPVPSGSPCAPWWRWHDRLATRTRVKSSSIQLRGAGVPSWSFLPESAASSAPQQGGVSQVRMILEGGGEVAGRRNSETQALGCLLSTFHTNSQPRKLTVPNALVPGGSEDAHEEVLPPCGHFL